MVAKVRNQSKKRDAILEKLCSTTVHPSAEWIYLQLKEEFPKLSLATVYRNLKQFLEEGTILSVATVAGQERFDGDTTSHAHFICKACHSVIDIALPLEYDEVLVRLEQSGCFVDQTSFTVSGICEACNESR